MAASRARTAAVEAASRLSLFRGTGGKLHGSSAAAGAVPMLFRSQPLEADAWRGLDGAGNAASPCLPLIYCRGSGEEIFGGFAAADFFRMPVLKVEGEPGVGPGSRPGDVDPWLQAQIDELICPSQDDDISSPMLMHTRRTFQPSTIVRKRRHGFLARKSTVGGRRVLARRLLKGRRKLSA